MQPEARKAIEPSDAKMRKCLSCGLMFMSAHRGNRICGTHKGSGNAKNRGVERPVFQNELVGKSV